MSTPTHARYINIMYLPFIKDKEGNYSLVNKEIKIEGPLPACEKIFENYQNCELIAASEYKQAGKLINFTWRGEQIQTDQMNLCNQYMINITKDIKTTLNKI